jgi:hypothetical protein
MPKRSNNSKKRFYFRLPDDFTTLSESEKEVYLDYFAKMIWQTMADNFSLKGGENNDK